MCWNTIHFVPKKSILNLSLLWQVGYHCKARLSFYQGIHLSKDKHSPGARFHILKFIKLSGLRLKHFFLSFSNNGKISVLAPYLLDNTYPMSPHTCMSIACSGSKSRIKNTLFRLLVEVSQPIKEYSN